MSKKRTHKEPYSFSLHDNKTEKEEKKNTTLFSTKKKRQMNELSQIFLEANTVAKKECQM